MTPDELRDRLTADFRVAHALRNSDRPAGLTASRLLGCTSQAARILLGQPESSTDDVYRGLRGTWIHDGMANDLALVDDGFTDGRKRRFTWSPGEGFPDITGEYDFAFDGTLIEVKTRNRDECRWHASHGADPQHAAQVSAGAAAEGYQQAFVVYLPTDSGIEEMAVCEVDIGHWLRQTLYWLRQVDVRDEVEHAVERGITRERAVQRVLDPLPREPAVSWCVMFCPFVSACRGDYVPPPDYEITDPVKREAGREAEYWRRIRLHAEKEEKAARTQLRGVEGLIHPDPGDGPVVRVRKGRAEPAPAG